MLNLMKPYLLGIQILVKPIESSIDLLWLLKNLYMSSLRNLMLSKECCRDWFLRWRHGEDNLEWLTYRRSKAKDWWTRWSSRGWSGANTTTFKGLEICFKSSQGPHHRWCIQGVTTRSKLHDLCGHFTFISHIEPTNSLEAEADSY